jgi:hypothetical protein
MLVKDSNKKIVIIAGAFTLTLSLLGGGAYLLNKKANDSFNKDTITINTSTTTTTKYQTTVSTTTTKQETVIYIINNLNKKDGSIFSIPDIISFNISPNVEQSKVILTDENGIILYSKTATGSSVNLTVYMEGRVSEGSNGKLRIEGIVSGKSVITKEVGVVF